MLKPIMPMTFKDVNEPSDRLHVYRASHGGACLEASPLHTSPVVELSRDNTVKLRDYLTRLLDEA